MALQTVTKQIELMAEATAVFALIANPRLVPKWAAAFADRMDRSSAGQWIATKGDQQFAMTVEISNASRTVDYVRDLPTGRRGGAYIRIIDAPQSGCVVVMTIPITKDSNADETSAVLESELAGLARMA
jgi:hypothetical protein